MSSHIVKIINLSTSYHCIFYFLQPTNLENIIFAICYKRKMGKKISKVGGTKLFSGDENPKIFSIIVCIVKDESGEGGKSVINISSWFLRTVKRNRRLIKISLAQVFLLSRSLPHFFIYLCVCTCSKYF